MRGNDYCQGVVFDEGEVLSKRILKNRKCNQVVYCLNAKKTLERKYVVFNKNNPDKTRQ